MTEHMKNPGAGTPGPIQNQSQPNKNITNAAHCKDYVRAPLIREYLVEQANIMGSLAISFAEAEWRENDFLAGIHLDQIRLVGRELVRSYAELSTIVGGAQ